MTIIDSTTLVNLSSEPDVTPESMIIEAARELEKKSIERRDRFMDLSRRRGRAETDRTMLTEDERRNEVAVQYGKVFRDALAMAFLSFEGQLAERHFEMLFGRRLQELFRLWQGRSMARIPFRFLLEDKFHVDLKMNVVTRRHWDQEKKELIVPGAYPRVVYSPDLCRFMAGQYDWYGRQISDAHFDEEGNWLVDTSKPIAGKVV